MLSTLDALYVFARAGPHSHDVRPADFDEQTDVHLLDAHLGELAVIIGLAPFWQADLRRPWLPQIPATDDSQDFGYCISVAGCTVNLAREAWRFCAA